LREENVLSKLSRRTVLLLAGFAALFVFASVGLAGGGKIKNGNFETGDLFGWQTQNETSNGDWFVSNKKVTPIGGQSWFGPMEKEFEAVSDQGNYDSNFLYQEVKVQSKTTRISFDLEWNNRAGVWCNPGDFDANSSCGSPEPYNQQFAVYLQNFGADPMTDPVVKMLVQSKSSTPFKQGKTKYQFSNLPVGDWQLVFAAVAGEYVLNLGVDEVVQNNG